MLPRNSCQVCNIHVVIDQISTHAKHLFPVDLVQYFITRPGRNMLDEPVPTSCLDSSGVVRLQHQLHTVGPIEDICIVKFDDDFGLDITDITVPGSQDLETYFWITLCRGDVQFARQKAVKLVDIYQRRATSRCRDTGYTWSWQGQPIREELTIAHYQTSIGILAMHRFSYVPFRSTPEVQSINQSLLSLVTRPKDFIKYIYRSCQSLSNCMNACASLSLHGNHQLQETACKHIDNNKVQSGSGVTRELEQRVDLQHTSIDLQCCTFTGKH